MSHDRAIQVIQHRTFLQPQGLDHGQHALHEPASCCAVATEGVLAPQHAQAQDPFRMIVRGLDPLDRREQPQRRVQSQEVGAKGRCFGIRAGATLLQNALEFARDRVQPSLQARSVQFATAESPPVGEQAFHDLQAYPANCFSGSSSIDQLLKVAFQVRPADLPQFQGKLAVDRPAVATDNAGDRIAQEGLQALEAAPEVNHEEGHRRGRRRPQPALLSLLAPTAFVSVLHRGLSDRLLCLLIRTGEGSGGLSLERGDRAQGDRHLENGLDDLFHSPSADVMTAAEVRHHCGQAWADDMGADLRGDIAAIEVATAGAGARESLVLGDDRRQLGEFGNLMPTRLGVPGPWLGGQRSLAVGAGRGHIGHDRRDPLGREATAMMPRMSGLTARLAPTGGLDHWLGSVQGIGRRRDRGVRRIPVEPFLKVTDGGFKLSDPLAELSTMRAIRYWRRQLVAHAAEQYRSLVVWQEQLASRDDSTSRSSQRHKRSFGPLRQKRCQRGH